MARTPRGKEVLEKAKELLSKARTVEELRQAQAVVLPWSTVFQWSVLELLPACPRDGRVICDRSSSVQRVLARNGFGAADGVRT